MKGSNQYTGGCPGNCSCCEGKTNTGSIKGDLTIALAGQPNTGKSTIFNMLTGARQHVGNWPGKTIEKKEGIFTLDGQTGHVVDLPGTYSLTANSQEETIARDFILHHAPDVVVIVVDASQLERTLYMVAEVVLFPVPLVIVLNKKDAAEKKGITIDAKKLEESTGVKTIAMSALTGEGKDELIKAILSTDNDAEYRKPDLNKSFGPVYKEVLELLRENEISVYPVEWAALKLLEEDKAVVADIKNVLDSKAWHRLEVMLKTCKRGTITGADARFTWIKRLTENSQISEKGSVKQHRFDRLALHPLGGTVISLVILVLGIIAAYIIMVPLMIPGYILFLLAAGTLRDVLIPVSPLLGSMFCDGILYGVSAGFVMLGFIGGVFFILGILESSGYLARLAYMFDPYMNRAGLHGKSVIPLLMGLVCNIFGVMGTRVIDSSRQRLVTLVVTPVIPCKALLLVIGFITAIFFGHLAVPIFLSLIVVMIAYIIMTSFFLRKYILPGEQTGLIMELPPYQKPIWKDVFMYVYAKVKSFWHRGFWFITIAFFLTWAAVYFPGGSIENSYLAAFGHTIEPLGRIMGLDWRLFIVLIISFFSKEATLGVMAIIFGAAVSDTVNVNFISIDMAIWAVVNGDFGAYLASAGITPASALAFIYAVFFSLPCTGTLAIIYGETRSYKWTAGVLCYSLFMTFLMGSLAYRAGLLIF